MTNTTSNPRPGLLGLLSRMAPGRHRDTVMQATWNGVVVAESDDTVLLEGNHYFPADAVDPDVLRASSHRTVCPWKGLAGYHDIEVDGEVARSGAWFYANPSPLARKIAGRVAFSPGVEVRPVE